MLFDNFPLLKRGAIQLLLITNQSCLIKVLFFFCGVVKPCLDCAVAHAKLTFCPIMIKLFRLSSLHSKAAAALFKSAAIIEPNNWIGGSFDEEQKLDEPAQPVVPGTTTACSSYVERCSSLVLCSLVLLMGQASTHVLFQLNPSETQSRLLFW